MEATASKKFNFKTGFYVAAGIAAAGIIYIILDKTGMLAKWMPAKEEEAAAGE